jgi:hypothetical protein
MAWYHRWPLSWLDRKPRPRVRKRPRTIPPRVRELEPRKLFNASAWLGHDPLPAGNAAGMNQDPWLTPALAILNPQNAVNGTNVTASLTTSGTFTVGDTGSYNFTIQLTGANSTDSITFSESGTVSFTLSETGSITNGAYSVSTYSLTQNGTATWQFTETTLAGVTVQNSSGTDYPSTTSTTSALVDPLHWYDGAWDDLLSYTSGQHGFNLGSYAWNSFMVTASGSYSLTYNETGTDSFSSSGTGLIGADGTNGPPGGLPDLLTIQAPGGDSQSTDSSSFLFSRLGSYT